MITTVGKGVLAASIALGAVLGPVVFASAGPDSVVGDRVKQLTRAMPWKQVATIPVNFNTQHPQGMVKIGDTFYLTSVEIKTPTKRFPQLQDGFDRDTGEGAGHLFKFDAKRHSDHGPCIRRGLDLSPRRDRL